MSTPPLPAGYALDATPPLPAGYALDSSAPAEQEKPGFLSQAWDKAVSMFPSKEEALRALGGSGVTAYHLATNPKEAFAKLAQESPGFAQTQEYLRSRQTGSSIPRSVLNAAGTLVGVDPAAEEAAAARGDTAGVAADAAVPAAAAIAGYGLHLGAPKIGAALSDVATNFKPQLMAGADALQHPTELPGRAIKAALNAIPDGPEVVADKQLKADAVAMRTRNLQARVAESKAADAAGQTVPEYRAAQKAAAKAAIPATPEASPIITTQSPDIPSEGRPATWRNIKVSDLASQGGPLSFDAAKQAQLRQLDVPNVGLIADPRAIATPTLSSPRSVTIFDAHGNPVPSEGNFAYRVRDVGESGVPIGGNSRAHATTTLEDAQRLAPGREDVQGKPQQIVRYDLSKLKEGKDYERVPREGQPDWIRMLRPMPEGAVEPVPQ